jgi:hypothetical protein
MNKSIVILLFVVVVCFVLCGCENNSKHSLELSSPSVIPPSQTLTLSQQQLVFLDWHSPNLARARVTGKRVVPGPGVEFDIYFPSNAPDCRSVHYVSSGEGGIGALVGADVRGYEKFALAFTLVSINGQTVPNEKEKVEVGALIGPTAVGGLSDYKPVTLSLVSSEKSKVAKTPMRTNKIYQIGFYVRLLEPENWNPIGNEIVLRVEPVEDAGFVPLQTTGQP